MTAQHDAQGLNGHSPILSSPRKRGPRGCRARCFAWVPAFAGMTRKDDCNDAEHFLRRRTLLGLIALLPAAMAARHSRAAIPLEGDFIQGGLLIGQADAGSKVMLDETDIRVFGDGRFLLGFGRDAPAKAALRITLAGGVVEARDLAIAQRKYEIQRIDNLPQNQVEPSEQDLARIKVERERIAVAKQRLTPTPSFDEGFDWPATGRISGVYGSQRILNGQPRQPHFGVDVAAPVETPLKAPAGGVVSLADPDLFFTGGTVMLDHGYGLTSIFAHQQKVLVKEGDMLAKGDVFGLLGGTGRVTGPHLHWGIYLGTIPLDPQLLVPPMPSG
jgi:murein DD-endopeptidase MepM/ murein hydrolase activator NlpD